MTRERWDRLTEQMWERFGKNTDFPDDVSAGVKLFVKCGGLAGDVEITRRLSPKQEEPAVKRPA